MLQGYVPIVVMLVLSAAIAVGMVAGSFLLGPRRPTRFKESPYECGITPVGSAHERFPVRFYLVAMLFIIFDIETIFLYPWAVTYRGLAQPAKVFFLFEMAGFVVILFVGYFYVWGKGALDWEEGRATAEEPASVPAGIKARRPPIRFGNEASGPVRLPGGGSGANAAGGSA